MKYCIERMLCNLFLARAYVTRKLVLAHVTACVTTQLVMILHACRFYTHQPAFERERELYEATELKSMMPATHAIVDNADGSVRASSGYVFPPCIIIERGESLEQWARREADRDFVTTLQVRVRGRRWRHMCAACTHMRCSDALAPAGHALHQLRILLIAPAAHPSATDTSALAAYVVSTSKALRFQDCIKLIKLTLGCKGQPRPSAARDAGVAPRGDAAADAAQGGLGTLGPQARYAPAAQVMYASTACDLQAYRIVSTPVTNELGGRA